MCNYILTIYVDVFAYPCPKRNGGLDNDILIEK